MNVRLLIELDGLNTAVIAHWVVNLVRRMGHAVTMPAGYDPVVNNKSLSQLCRELNALAATTAAEGDMVLVVGPTARPDAVNVWSDGWTVWINKQATESWNHTNPLAAAAAACVAAAFVHGRRHDRKGFRFNLLTYDATPMPGSIQPGTPVPEFTLAGVGAVGSSVCLALSHLGLTNPCRLVDDQTLDAGNVIRYVTAKPGDENLGKAEVAAALLGPQATPVTDDILNCLEQPPKLLVCAVHDAETRHRIAGYLPELVLDGAIGSSADGSTARIEVSIATFPPRGPCLACFYQVPGRDQLLAERLGIRRGELDVPLTQEMRLRIERHNARTLPDHVLGTLPRNLPAEFCGSVPVLGEPQPDVRPERIFGPALAGVFLAAELVKIGLGNPPIDNTLRWDVTYPLTEDHQRRLKPLANCPNCTDPDVLEHMSLDGRRKGR